MGGLYLTNDANEPTKWQIPTNNPTLTTIPAGGFLMIWADGDTTDAGLHAGFKLNAEGDNLYLYEPDGITRIDSVEFGPQIPNVSYGRYPDDSAEWQFLTQATRGQPTSRATTGVVSGREVQPGARLLRPGRSRSPSTCDTPGAVIYYTTDGSEPYKEGGRVPNGKAYVGPVANHRDDVPAGPGDQTRVADTAASPRRPISSSTRSSTSRSRPAGFPAPGAASPRITR